MHNQHPIFKLHNPNAQMGSITDSIQAAMPSSDDVVQFLKDNYKVILIGAVVLYAGYKIGTTKERVKTGIINKYESVKISIKDAPGKLRQAIKDAGTRA